MAFLNLEGLRNKGPLPPAAVLDVLVGMSRPAALYGQRGRAVDPTMLRVSAQGDVDLDGVPDPSPRFACPDPEPTVEAGIFRIGLVLGELTGGRVGPAPADPEAWDAWVGKVASGAPAGSDLEAVIRELLVADPEGRPPSTDLLEIAKALREADAGPGLSAWCAKHMAEEAAPAPGAAPKETPSPKPGRAPIPKPAPTPPPAQLREEAPPPAIPATPPPVVRVESTVRLDPPKSAAPVAAKAGVGMAGLAGCLALVATPFLVAVLWIGVDAWQLSSAREATEDARSNFYRTLDDERDVVPELVAAGASEPALVAAWEQFLGTSGEPARTEAAEQFVLVMSTEASTHLDTTTGSPNGAGKTGFRVRKILSAQQRLDGWTEVWTDRSNGAVGSVLVSAGLASAPP